jgi:glutamate synthase (NADPH) small chain
MASTCPKCHQVIENDSVCCADVQYTWKCKSCGKLSTGFVVPFGRCYLCGGENEVIQGGSNAQPELVAIVREAAQYEVDMYHFYRLAMERTSDAVLKSVLEEMSHKEEDHIGELEKNYHLHLDPNLLELPKEKQRIFAEWLFRGIDFGNAKKHIPQVYEKAIAMERLTRDRYLAHAADLPAGSQKEIYRELAAEEMDHIATLETEREQFLKK